MSLLNLDNLPKKGAEIMFKFRGASLQMVINNARVRYGKIDVELVPVAGTGSFWAQYDTLVTPTDTVGDKLAELAGINA